MSEFAPENASLAERLDHFFNVELPGDSELAARYETDPDGTLGEHFSDLPGDVLADAMFHLGQSTTASFAGASASATDQFDGESDYAFALRASSDGGPDSGDFGPGEFDSAGATGSDPGFDPNAGLDPSLDGVFDTPLDDVGAEFGFGGTSFAEADPSFDGTGLESFSASSSVDAGPPGGQPAPGPDHPAGEWQGDLSDAGLDDESPDDESPGDGLDDQDDGDPDGGGPGGGGDPGPGLDA